MYRAKGTSCQTTVLHISLKIPYLPRVPGHGSALLQTDLSTLNPHKNVMSRITAAQHVESPTYERNAVIIIRAT